MKRYLLDQLINWKENPFRKPLILWGARQVGKTWLLKEFGKKHFDNMVYISFYKNNRIGSLFAEDYNVHRIISSIEIEMHVEIKPKETLLIFDEIQGCPQVLESLKYFCEDAGEYMVASAGSLLGVALHEGVSFPVGKVDELHLFPMSFEEFLEAVGEERLAAILKERRIEDINFFSNRYQEFLKQYYIIGGMPEVVKRFSLHQDYTEAREIQLSIINQYEGDFGKHIKENELPRIRMVWNSIPLQLAKENKKFFFGKIKKGARQKEFEIAIQWLVDAGLLNRVYKVSKPAVPLKAYVDFSAFKLFMIDVGLLGAMSELDPDSVILGDEIFTEYKGALTEQYVLQQIIASTEYRPYYYSGEKSTYETDFLIQKSKDVIPVEVKAGENVKSKSLRVYYEKYHPSKAVRISMSLYREQEWMINIPLWAVGMLL